MANWQDPKNLAIFIKKGAERKTEFGIDGDMTDRVVQVRGIVVLYEKKPEIIVTEPAELKWLPK